MSDTQMIKEVTGDILLSNAQAIAHGVAPFDHFENGLALSIRQEWPSMFKDFKHYCQQHNPKPGTAWFWGGAGGRRIINLLTQEPPTGHKHGGHAGRASLSNVEHALEALKKIVAAEGIKSVALPRLATGVGGLNWDDVRKAIFDKLSDLDVEVFVYSTYKKGVAGE